MLSREFNTKWGVFVVQENIECTIDYCYYDIFKDGEFVGELWTDTSLYNKKLKKELEKYLKEKYDK